MKSSALAFNVTEVCKLTSLGRTTLYKAIKSGDLKAQKLGRRTIITFTELSRWLSSLPNGANAHTGEIVEAGRE